MTVIVTAVFHPAAGHTAALVAALQSNIPAVHQEHGCQLYAIHDAADGTITMIEKWDSAEDLAAHADEAVAALAEAVKDHIQRPTTVTTMAPIPAGTAQQGQL